ncbi:MAG: alpha/beta hydrolase [Clostridia bacterium]|nr:alpha/beta hydrolase [Clostridia bacterium]
MKILVNNININYEVFGEGKDVLVLHGWGADIRAIKPVADALSGSFKVWLLDLPGFGQSDLPPEDWDVYAYADFVKRFADTLEIVNPILIGHSFGGRLSIILSAKKIMTPPKIILVDSAGIKPRHGLDYYCKVYTYKIMKRVAAFIGKLSKPLEEKIKGKFGSSDYKNANPIMRKVMVRVVNEDLTYLLKDIACPTLLFWGEKDDATPLSDAKKMEKLIPDAGVVTVPGGGHYSYIDNFPLFNAVSNKFLEKDIL